MELQKIGGFLAVLRKEQGLTQEQLGERLGVTNKTVSRWEKGNYLPPAEMLKSLSELYGVSINELLSGKRLSEETYRAQAEENITAIIRDRRFSPREILALAGQWLRKNWWAVAVCVLPAAGLYGAMPFAVSGKHRALTLAGALLLTGVVVLFHHLLFHVGNAEQEMEQEDAHKLTGTVRAVWLAALGVMLFVSVDLLLALLHALTPAGNRDGYHVYSMFYDVLIEDGGIYPDNCFRALESALWSMFLVVVINLDLAILWIRRRRAASHTEVTRPQ